MRGSSSGAGAGAATGAGVGIPAPVLAMNCAVSIESSSKTFATSVSISSSSSDSSKASSIISSAMSALAISDRISSIVLCNSGTLIRRFISFITAPDIFKELAVDICAMAVVRCKFTAVMEHFVLSSRAAVFLDRTTCLARVFTLATCPFAAMDEISFLSLPSSCLILLISRSRRRHSPLNCLCHSRAFSFTRSSLDLPWPIAGSAES
mmetsp:Transcript_97751/g.276513  ORF Transcript_97751/g.276513 Transcript_97751/m.276513 type:complete len:208 (+) Transcript_97751:124-747(+)